MADGKITISIDLEDGNVEKGLVDIKRELGIVDTSAQKATTGFKSMTAAMLAVKVASKAIDVLKSSLDGAVKRFDTLNQFPRMMQSLGYSAQEAQGSIDRLAEGIDGLPTALDDVAASTQSIALITGDLDEATGTALALNDAFLASGASVGDVSRGMTQYTQMLAAGKVDMQSWKTLMETMPYALNKVAESFGFTGRSAKQDLYNALKEGNITFDELNAKLIELDGGLGGFAEMARINSEGIGTSFENIKTAVVKGVTELIKSFDKATKSLTGKNIAQNLNSLKGTINTTFKTMAKSVETGAKAFKVLEPAIKAVTIAFIAFKAASAISSVISSASAAIKLSKLAVLQYTAALSTNTAAQLVNNGTITVKTALLGGLSTGLGIVKSAQLAWNVAMTANPIGVVVAGVTALVGGIAFLTKAFQDNTAEAKALAAEHKELIDNSKELASSARDNVSASKDSFSAINSEAGAYKDLAKKTVDLANQKNKTSGQVAQLTGYINALNSSVEGLNLAYDEATGTLNMTEEAILSQVDAWKSLAEAQAAQEAMVDAIRDQYDIENQLSQLKEKTAGISKSEKEQMLEHSKIRGLYNEETVEAVETEKELKDQLKATTEHIGFLDGKMQESVENQEANAAALADSNAKIVTSYDDMSESGQAAFDRVLSAYEVMTSGLSSLNETIERDYETTWESIQATQDHTISETQTFADLYAQLVKEGISESYLNAIGATGPESIPLLQGMLDSGIETVKGKEDEWKSAYDSLRQKGLESFAEGLDSETASLLNDYIAGETGILGTMKSSIEAADFTGIGTKVNEEVGNAIETSAAETTAGQEIPQKVAQNVSENTEPLNQAGTQVAETVKTSVNAGMATADFSGVGKKVSSDIALGITLNNGLVQSSLTTLLNTFKTSISQSNTTVQTGMTTMNTTFKSAMTDMENNAKSGMDNFKTAVTDGMTAASQAVSDGKAKIVATLSGLGSTFYSYGFSAMQMLASGITAGTPAAVRAAQNAAAQIQGAMSAAASAGSPSNAVAKMSGTVQTVQAPVQRSLFARMIAPEEPEPQLAMATTANFSLPVLRAENILGGKVASMLGTTTNNHYYGNNEDKKAIYFNLDVNSIMDAEAVGRGSAVYVAEENEERGYILKKVRGE